MIAANAWLSLSEQLDVVSLPFAKGKHPIFYI